MEVTSKSAGRVFAHDVRAAKVCHRGAREFCTIHGLAWTDLLGDGIPAQVLLDTRDPVAARIVAVARVRDE